MASAKSTNRGRPKSRLRDDAAIARILQLRKTMTWPEVSREMGASVNALAKVISEECDGPAETYRPRLLSPWPNTTDFSIDNLAVTA